MSDILIKKYYLDCVDDEGRAFIGYSVQLEWHSVNVQYQSYLLSDGASHIDSRSSLKRNSFPSINHDAIEWNSPPLDVHGTWLSACPRVRRTLASTPECEILWDCLQPQSDCYIQAGPHRTIRGRGYAECLELRLAEWRLPLSELRWGRFLSDGVSLVWIDWAGSREQHLVFWNGVSVDHCTIGDEQLLIPERNASLSLRRRSVLKESSIVPPAIRKIPGLSPLLPRSLAHSHESKWLSKGTLTQPDAPDFHGWAIHERVVFR